MEIPPDAASRAGLRVGSCFAALRCDRARRAAAGAVVITADATGTARAGRARRGRRVLYSCASPPYHRWPRDWPWLATSMLWAAERTAAVLVIMSKLYGYGPAAHPMTEGDPPAAAGPEGKTRAAVCAQALAAHQAGRVRVTEARASEFFGPGVRQQSPVGERPVPRLLAGKPVSVLGDPDTPAQLDLPGIVGTLVAPGRGRTRLGPCLARAGQPADEPARDLHRTRPPGRAASPRAAARPRLAR